MPNKAPQIITAQVLANSSISLNWTGLSDEDFQGASQGYKIIYKERNSTLNYEVQTEYGSTHTTVVYNLQPDKSYTFRVLAFNVYGDGPPGAAVNVTIQEQTSEIILGIDTL